MYRNASCAGKGKNNHLRSRVHYSLWGFTVFGVILLYCMEGRTILSGDWIEAGIILLIIAVGCILLPENLLKKRDTQYYFENNGYYDKFLKNVSRRN